MVLTKKIILFATGLALCLSLVPLGAQTRPGALSLEAAKTVSEEMLTRDVNFYASEYCGGRVSGTPGGALAAEYTAWRFSSTGIRPFGDSFMKRFSEGETFCINVMGMIPAFGAASADKYIIVAAHFDNLAPTGGNIYPGADSNASGVAALNAIATMFGKASALGQMYPQNIIFVALDAKQADFAGARELWRALVAGELTDPVSNKPVKASNISLFVNMDILGSSLAPLQSGREDYLLMLGGDERQIRLLKDMNTGCGTALELSFDYYGSAGVTDMFLRRVSDQKVFMDHGVKAVMFTSGITDHTNRPDDTPDTLNMPVLYKRTMLIFHWLSRAVYSN